MQPVKKFVLNRVVVMDGAVNHSLLLDWIIQFIVRRLHLHLVSSYKGFFEQCRNEKEM